jgi:hypothetical protein
MLYILRWVADTLAETMSEHWELFGWGRLMLLAGAALLYVASRAGVHALGGVDAGPGRRAIGHWIPIAATVLAALAIRRGDLVISIIFATSVGCLSLFVGSIAIVCPDADAPAAFRRIWPLVLPAALLALLAGFAAELSWRHGLILLIEGGALLLGWQELSVKTESAAMGRGKLWAVNLGLSICLALVGGAAAIFGMEHISHELPQISDKASVVAILGPLLVLPMLMGGAALTPKNRAWVATTSAVGVVLLNLCLLLPMAIFLRYPVNAAHWDPSAFFHVKFHSLREVSPMPFAWVTWRVDNVVLVLLSFALLPASMGRWRLGRAEGFTLIALYAVYVLMVAAGSMRA